MVLFVDENRIKNSKEALARPRAFDFLEKCSSVFICTKMTDTCLCCRHYWLWAFLHWHWCIHLFWWWKFLETGMFSRAKESMEPFAILLLSFPFPVKWSTHAVPDLFADLWGGIQHLVPGLGRGTSGHETHVSAHPTHVVKNLVTLRRFPDVDKLTVVLLYFVFNWSTSASVYKMSSWDNSYLHFTIILVLLINTVIIVPFISLNCTIYITATHVIILTH